MTKPTADILPLLPWVLPLLVIAVMVLVAWNVRTNRRLARISNHYHLLTQGVDGGNLEALLERQSLQVQQALERFAELERLTRELDGGLRTSLRRIGMKRFNPFRDAGGDQSFALVLADEDGNGVAISSLHGRDVTRIYAKPLSFWTSTYLLTAEEQEALSEAQNGKAA